MVGTLGDGLRAIRGLTQTRTECPPSTAGMKSTLEKDLLFEAQKFLIYRAWKLRERQSVSVHRLRCLLTLLEELEARS
jgi:hypothetical protein